MINNTEYMNKYMYACMYCLPYHARIAADGRGSLVIKTLTVRLGGL